MTGEAQYFQDHAIILIHGPVGPELLIDDSPVPLRQMPGGGYVLDEDAYGVVSTDPLLLAREFLGSDAIARYRLDQAQAGHDSGGAK